MLAVASPAGAASSCGRAVIDDWYDNGRVDGTYALHCYDDAIDILPRDVRDYSSAKDDIQRALQARKRGEAAPPATADPTPGDDDGSTSGGGGSGGGSGGSGTPGGETPSETAGPTDDGVDSEAGGAIDAESRQRQLRPDTAPDPRRPRASARRGRLRGLRGPPHPGAPAAAVDLELSRRPGGSGGYTVSTVSRFAKRLFVRFPASVRCWV